MALSDLLSAQLAGIPGAASAFSNAFSWLPAGAQNSPTIEAMFRQMLTPDQGLANAAAQARQNQAASAASQASGLAGIQRDTRNLADSYAAQAQQAHLDANLPALQDAYEAQRKQALYGAWRGGNAESSAATQGLASLFKDYDRQRLAVGQQALAAGDQARHAAQAQGQQAQQALDAAQVPYQTATWTANMAQYSQPKQSSPLANMFGQVLGDVGNALAAQRQGYSNPWTAFFPGLSGNSSGIA